MVFALSPDEQSVLLVHERGRWKAVGGAVDAGKSVVDTAVREL
jgi:8-oxo-dGTP pyrophosphatase MutT (NUDIX family)